MKQILRVIIGLLIAFLAVATEGRALGAPAAGLRSRPARAEIGQPTFGESYGYDGRGIASNRRDRSQQRAGSADFYNYDGFVRIVRRQFTAKLRDYESGLNLDYFGARYFAGAQGRFTTPDLPLLAALENSQTWNLYSYTANNPLSRIDPDGRNWFQVNGNWEWHDGDEYTYEDKKGKSQTLNSNYTHLVVCEKTRTNRYGAATGTVSLYGSGYGDKLAEPAAFSGGVPGQGPVPEGTFKIRLDIRDVFDPGDLRQGRAGIEASPFFGIQEIPRNVGGYDVRWE